MVKESYLQFLLDILYCTQNDKFCCFLRLKSVLWKKIVQYLLRFTYLFWPKISKNDSRRSFIKKLLDNTLYVQSFTAYSLLFLWPEFSLKWLALVWFKLCVKWIEIHYEISVSFAGFLLCSLCIYILNVLPLWKINFDMSAFDW